MLHDALQLHLAAALAFRCNMLAAVMQVGSCSYQDMLPYPADHSPGTVKAK